MSTPQATHIATQWFERVWQQRSQEAIFELLHEKAVAHQPGGGSLIGPGDFKQLHDQVIAGLPDQQLKILRIMGDETQAFVHWEVSGTHSGNLFGVAPTQKKVCFDGMTFLQVKDGQVTEGWDCWDMTGLMANLAKAD